MKTRNSTTKKRTERLLGGGNTTEKVGSDILGRQEEIRIQLEKEKQKQEFLRKREAERKKKELDDLQGKRLHTEMPNDQHKPRKLGREGFDQIKPVKVSAHRRHSPKRGAKTE